MFIQQEIGHFFAKVYNERFGKVLKIAYYHSNLKYFENKFQIIVNFLKFENQYL